MQSLGGACKCVSNARSHAIPHFEGCRSVSSISSGVRVKTRLVLHSKSGLNIDVNDNKGPDGAEKAEEVGLYDYLQKKLRSRFGEHDAASQAKRSDQLLQLHGIKTVKDLSRLSVIQLIRYYAVPEVIKESVLPPGGQATWKSDEKYAEHLDNKFNNDVKTWLEYVAVRVGMDKSGGIGYSIKESLRLLELRNIRDIKALSKVSLTSLIQDYHFSGPLAAELCEQQYSTYRRFWDGRNLLRNPRSSPSKNCEPEKETKKSANPSINGEKKDVETLSLVRSSLGTLSVRV